MKRTAIALLLGLLVAPVAVRADDARACLVAADPRGDVAAARVAETAAAPSWLDVTGLRVEHDTLVIDVPRLDELENADHSTAAYEVVWHAGSTHAFARAVSMGGRWRFDQGRFVSGGDRIQRRAGGAVTARSVTILATLPAVMTGVRAEASQLLAAADAPAAFADHAPNLGAQRLTVRPGSGCIDRSAKRCLVAADRIGDERVSRPDQKPAETAADAGDIVAVHLAANRTTLIAELELASDAPIAGAEGERWEIAWQNPWRDKQLAPQTAFAERRGTRLEFGYDAGGGWTSAQGRVDGTIARIELPRDALGIPDGTRIRDVAAASFALLGGTRKMRDRAPDEGGAAWVVGSTCAQREAPVCPVAVDARGDGRLIDADGDTPRNEAWLDLRSAGSSTWAERLTMSVRVMNLRADEPAGADLTGWTVSWDLAGRRYFAQAERGATGVTYRFGARGEGAGPVFSGVRTSGAVDPARGLITIAVPRASVGAPAEGAALDGFDASSWASYGTGTTAATIQVVDTTATRRYLTGTDCSA